MRVITQERESLRIPIRQPPAAVADSHPRLPYRPDVDGLRAVAVVAVVVYHAFPGALRAGFTGVDVFFVISGYLISSLIWRGLEEERFSLLAFYGRRVLRLFPALVLVLAACLAAGWWLLVPGAYERLGRDTAAAAGYFSNFVFWRESGYFAPAASARPLTHLWSLAVEEQFYLLYPWLLIAAFRRRRATVLLLVGLLVASFAVSVVMVQIDPAEAFYLLPSRLWELIAGGLLAYVLVRLRKQPSRLVANALSLCGLALLPLAFLGPRGGAFPGWWALAPVAAAVLIIGGGPRGALNRGVLARRPLVLVGRISYPFYLWHFPLLAFARARYGVLSTPGALLVVALSFVLAYATFRLVETPLRFRIRHVSWKPVPLLAVLMLALGGGGFAIDASAGWPNRLPPLVQKLAGFTYDYKPVYREGTCFLRNTQDATAFDSSCVEAGTKPLVLLWGDSHAADLYPGLRALETRHRFRIAQFTASSCPPFVRYASADRPYCAGVNKAVIARIRALHPREVLLSAAWYRYRDDTLLVETVELLRRLHVPSIVVVGPSPEWPQGMPQALYATYQQRNSVPLRVSRGLSDRPTRADATMRALARRLRIPYVAPLDALCNADGCLARTGKNLDELTVWDTAHFTRAGSVLLARTTERTLLDRIDR
jgi:peptidoglycan/LPS O-acetylase OafA/YrhL